MKYVIKRNDEVDGQAFYLTGFQMDDTPGRRLSTKLQIKSVQYDYDITKAFVFTDGEVNLIPEEYGTPFELV